MNNIDRKKLRSLIRESIQSRSIDNKFEIIKLYESNCIEQGIPVEQINEGIMDFAKEMLDKPAFIDSIKKSIIEGVMSELGLDVQNDQVMNLLLANIFEAVDFDDLIKLFGSGKCDALMEVVTEGIIETVTELGSSKILGYLSGMIFSDMSQKFVGPIINSLDAVAQESVNEVVVSLVQGMLQEPLKEIICNAKLTDAISSAGGGLGKIVGGFFGDDGVKSLGKSIMGAL